MGKGYMGPNGFNMNSVSIAFTGLSKAPGLIADVEPVQRFVPMVDTQVPFVKWHGLHLSGIRGSS